MIRFMMLAAFCVCQMACADQQYDHVTSVTVNGEEVAKPLTFGEWKEILRGQQPRIEKVVFSECTGNHEVTLVMSNPVVRLEYYPEENQKLDLDKLFRTATPTITDDALKARVWLDWPSLKAIRQEIRVGDMTIFDGIRAEVFAAHFPISYLKGGPDADIAEAVVFEVLFGVARAEDGTAELEEAPPYTPSVQFFFSKGRLRALKILQGVGC